MTERYLTLMLNLGEEQKSLLNENEEKIVHKCKQIQAHKTKVVICNRVKGKKYVMNLKVVTCSMDESDDFFNAEEPNDESYQDNTNEDQMNLDKTEIR